ncbi:MAG TPA: helix-turn-helix transcriptional regulator, partial [Vicinamibacterales bacterium]|nr:helix-turn-helix transcriptional regulator [Vicinamibacterales bacterium]
MSETFGTRLRRQRERKNIALATVAEQTKIHLPLLEELEHDDVRHWPSGIFRRAFVRAYARAIGLEPDDVVREFLALYPDPTEVVSIGAALATVAGTRRNPPTRLQQAAGSAVDWVLDKWRGASRQDGTDVERDMPFVAERPAGAPARTPPEMFDLDLLAAAHLCTKLAQADADSDVTLLLHEAARIVDSVGIIVWEWEPDVSALTPALADGYSDEVLAQLPKVRRESNNATAAAFRSGQTCAVAAGDRATSALAVPVLAPSGCVGVLAVELPAGAEQRGSTRAVVTIVASQLGRLLEGSRAAHVESAFRRT